MPEFNIDDESKSLAKTFSRRLTNEIRRASEGPPSSLRPGGTYSFDFSVERMEIELPSIGPIHDVLLDTSQMAMEFAAARRWEGAIPYLRLTEGQIAPISLREYFGGPPSLPSGFWSQWLDSKFEGSRPGRIWEQVFAAYEETYGKIERLTANFREVESDVQNSLSDFLAHRFAGMRQWNLRESNWLGPRIWRKFRNRPREVDPTAGLLVEVSCSTPGLRIHISPAYFINWAYFGSPTTPVAGFVLPGRYIFAGDGPSMPKRKKDSGVFSIPADYYPVLTRF